MLIHELALWCLLFNWRFSPHGCELKRKQSGLLPYFIQKDTLLRQMWGNNKNKREEEIYLLMSTGRHFSGPFGPFSVCILKIRMTWKPIVMPKVRPCPWLLSFQMTNSLPDPTERTFFMAKNVWDISSSYRGAIVTNFWKASPFELKLWKPFHNSMSHFWQAPITHGQGQNWFHQIRPMSVTTIQLCCCLLVGTKFNSDQDLKKRHQTKNDKIQKIQGNLERNKDFSVTCEAKSICKTGHGRFCRR